MPTSNIDDLLMGGGGNSLQPETPEFKDKPEEIEENEQDFDYDEEEPESAPDDKADEQDDSDESDDGDAPENKILNEIDEYGNEKERMPKGMKERFDRKDRQHQREIEQRENEINQLRAQLSQQGASREVQQAAKDFEYDPEASGDWQQQLASFVRKEVESMTHEQQTRQQREQEDAEQREFATKFRQGMNKFNDFAEVISELPFEISDPMTIATRTMDNPAAFLYAAAKRNPGELERISKIRSPNAQMAEMIRLEQRMRQSKPTTKAPRPLGRLPEDATVKAKEKQKDLSGDALLASADAKRLTTVKTRLRGSR